MIDDIEKDEPGNSLSMSFLDVISCGMLSAVFLSLIFSLVGQKPPVLLQTHDFIQISFRVAEDDYRVWNVALTPPDSGGKEYCIPLDECNLDTTGKLQVSSNNTNPSSPEFLALAKYDLRLLGFNRRFYKSNTISSNESANSLQGNTSLKKTPLRMVIISAPTPGPWKARVFVRDENELALEDDLITDQVSDLNVSLSNRSQTIKTNNNIIDWNY